MDAGYTYESRTRHPVLPGADPGATGSVEATLEVAFLAPAAG